MANKIVKIGLPCSPSKRTGSKILKGFKVLITYGVAHKTYYAFEKRMNKGLWVLSLINGYNVEINPLFVVECEEVKLVVNEYNVKGHPGYTAYKTITEYYFLHLNEDLENIDSCLFDRDNDIKLESRLVLTEKIKL